MSVVVVHGLLGIIKTLIDLDSRLLKCFLFIYLCINVFITDPVFDWTALCPPRPAALVIFLLRVD